MYAVQLFGGQQIRPQLYQYGTVGGIYPQQTTTDPMTSMFSSMMPMIMMIMMMSIMMPMMKGVTSKA